MWCVGDGGVRFKVYQREEGNFVSVLGGTIAMLRGS